MYLFLIIFILIAPVLYGEPISLSNNPQLFLDDFVVGEMINIKRVITQPEKHPANPLIVKEHPWEKRIIEIYGTVMYDPDINKYRCWYLGNEYNNGIPDNPEYPTTVEYYTCYAESNDGVHWTKPMVGPEKFGVHEKHNIVIPGTHGFCVMRTPDDPNPKRRYKGLGGKVFGFSPDGIHWDTRDLKYAVGKNDTSSCVVRWNGEYLAYVRTQVDDPKWPGVMRGVGLCVSKDFEHWTKKETVFTTDKEDGYPWSQPYGMAVTPYGDVLIGIVWFIHLDKIPNNNSLGDQDAQLVVSRDGRVWNRVADRATFFEPTPNTWDQGRVFPGTTLFVKNNKIHLYYTGIDNRHGEKGGTMGIGLATLPEDRFVALCPDNKNQESILTTKLLRLTGNKLIINAEAKENDIQVALLDHSGKIIPGFERDKSKFLKYDDLRYQAVWQNGATQSSLADLPKGQPVSIRFILHNGALYAFQIIR